MFAECGRVKQTVSNIQRALKERFGLGVGLGGPRGSLPAQEVLWLWGSLRIPVHAAAGVLRVAHQP